MRRSFLLVALLAATIAGAGTAAPPPLTIGVTISQTGSAAGTAAYVLQGYQRWVGDANHHVQGNPQGSTYLPAVADVAKGAGYSTVALLANDAPGTLEICAGVRAGAQALGTFARRVPLRRVIAGGALGLAAASALSAPAPTFAVPVRIAASRQAMSLRCPYCH